MFSRYDAMAQSAVKDSVDQDNYPDPLTVNYNNIRLSQIPNQVALNKPDIERIWYFTTKHLQVSETDDILLTINNIPYVGMLSPGDLLYVPPARDLYGVTEISGLA